LGNKYSAPFVSFVAKELTKALPMRDRRFHFREAAVIGSKNQRYPARPR
jgi:hypothetical protein